MTPGACLDPPLCGPESVPQMLFRCRTIRICRRPSQCFSYGSLEHRWLLLDRVPNNCVIDFVIRVPDDVAHIAVTLPLGTKKFLSVNFPESNRGLCQNL